MAIPSPGSAIWFEAGCLKMVMIMKTLRAPGGTYIANFYDDGMVWLYRGNEMREHVRVPDELANVLKARLAMEDDVHEAMRDTWWCSVAMWRRLGVTNRSQVGNAIDAGQ